MRKHLKRRTLLRGALAGGVASIALPPLDAMFNLEQTAFADGSSQPRRYAAWFYGNGFIMDRFEPIGTGPDWQLNTHMAALAGVKDYLNVVTGLSNRCKQQTTHHEGMTVFNGYTMADLGAGQGFFSNPGGPTLDHRISQAVTGQTPISGIHLGASKAQSPADNGWTMHALSHRGYLQPNEAITNPSAAWEGLFGTYAQSKDDRELRQHILDSVKHDVARLKSKLGPADNIRLEAHLDSIAELEAKLGAAAPICDLPADPMFTNSDSINNEQLTLTSELMSDLIAYAFKCDLTRVATMMFLEGAAEPSLSEIPGHTGSWHEYSHDTKAWAVGSPFDTGQLFMIDRWAYFLNKMKDTVEFDGSTLLDNMMCLLSSDASDGSVHAITRQPMVIAGHGGGYLKYPGVHYQPAPLAKGYSYGSWPTPSEGNTSDVLLALLQGFEPGARWIGEEPDEQGDGAGSGTPLSAILA